MWVTVKLLILVIQTTLPYRISLHQAYHNTEFVNKYCVYLRNNPVLIYFSGNHQLYLLYRN